MTRLQVFIDTVRHAQIVAPSLELMLLLGLLMIALVFRAVRVGLTIAYLFAFRWGWLFVNETLAKKDALFMQAYVFLGITVLVLGVIGMMHENT